MFLVYCSGKCGTNTLINSLKPLGKMEWLHNLADCPRRPQFVKRITDLLNSSERVIVIDSFRDPIDRKISAYFQNITLDCHFNCSQHHLLSRYKKEGIKFILADFDKKVIDIENFMSSEEWKKFNYDVYNTPFDHKKKIQIKEENSKVYINLRFNDIDRWQNILRNSGIPELENFTLKSGNEANKKWYNEIYQHFKREFRLTRNQFSTILKQHDRKLKHFYTEEEYNAFIKKWESKLI